MNIMKESLPLDLDPMVVSPDLWKDAITTWPTLDLGKIFAYILSKKELACVYVGKYKP